MTCCEKTDQDVSTGTPKVGFPGSSPEPRFLFNRLLLFAGLLFILNTIVPFFGANPGCLPRYGFVWFWEFFRANGYRIVYIVISIASLIVGILLFRARLMISWQSKNLSTFISSIVGLLLFFIVFAVYCNDLTGQPNLMVFCLLAVSLFAFIGSIVSVNSRHRFGKTTRENWLIIVWTAIFILTGIGFVSLLLMTFFLTLIAVLRMEAYLALGGISAFRLILIPFLLAYLSGKSLSNLLKIKQVGRQPDEPSSVTIQDSETHFGKRGYSFAHRVVMIGGTAVLAAMCIVVALCIYKDFVAPPAYYSNARYVIRVLKGFGNAAGDYSVATAGNVYWNDGETEFKDANGEQLFNYRFVKGGYYHKYFSNSTETGPGKASKFVYLCYPIYCDAAKWAFYVDESRKILEVYVKDEETLAKFEGIRPNFNVPAGANRFERHGLEFVLK